MSQRPHVYSIVRNPTPNGGVSPNAYFPQITAEIRVYWPPLATDAEVIEALQDAINMAYAELLKVRTK